MYKEKRNILLSIFLFLQILIVAFLSGQPSLIEKYYVNGIYPVIARFLRHLFGWIPFSMGDILYGILIILLIRFIWNIIRNPGKNRKQQLFQFLAAISVFYFFFYLFWGLNYSRQPLTESLQLEKKEFNIDELEQITEKIIFKTKRLQSGLSEHDSLPVIITYSKEKIIELTSEGYSALGEKFPEFKYEPVSLKKSLFSLPLTYMGFSGYLNPLTGEAQVDYLIPKINLPFTCSHEVAHQMGIASENEANFVGFLASISHQDPYFQYAGYLLVLRYALIDIRRYDKKLFKYYLDQLPEGVLKNIRESDEFWRKYENPLEPFFKKFYDHYLKYNQQPDGLKTYNQIMDLLISYDKKNPF
ncbi:DUF3810 domain-containing protein [Lutimonas zeaxanthinifaciens]|uniref:DUF3810 domain-containing protein n=1 Tax=Lutimonas zeaxanthinifaciens TaxID=3060215 RepID=UPI00265C9260|nr:DUF3810 domain-containing protein [Lutimonas sp. YSD2104]WKK64847.1 DUF3810 domain-containing protein [Lutimonas sp. YSD2104]